MEAVEQVMKVIMQEEDRLLSARQKVARVAAARAQRTVFLAGAPAILLLLVMALFIERDLCWRAAMERALRQKERELQAANDQLGAANQHLEVLATQDALTGLLNRRAMEARLNAEVARAQRYGTPLSLLLLDVDHFKHYNDSFGHPAGDAALQRVGALLLGEARATDTVARYGGEEFALLLAATDAAGARLVAERVRAAIAAGAWPERAVTVSVGAATFRAHIEGGAAALVMEADKALYRAKEAGRNRIVHFFSLPKGAPAALAEPDERIKKANREAANDRRQLREVENELAPL
jgi:diguanylate cyclase (GGDEF)-like protein